MPTYRRVALSPDAPALPSTSMPAFAAVEPNGPHAAMAALDTLPRSCRVLAECGLQGAAAFVIPDGDNPATNGAGRIYPDETTARVVIRIDSVWLTPGHVLELRVLALPSGPLQSDQEVGTGDRIELGRGGTISMSVTYTNEDAETVTVAAAVSPPASEAAYGAEPASCFDALSWHTDIARPWAGLPSAADSEKWTRGRVWADFTVSYTGSPRVVQLQVVERPAEIVVDIASSEWPTAMYAGAGQPYPELPSDYPITQLSTADKGGGLVALRLALEQHGAQLGPCLAWWSCATEEAGSLLTWIAYDSGTGDDEAPPITGSQTTYRSIPYNGAPPLSGLPGYHTGGYARQASASNEWLDGRTGVLPVWMIAYAKGTDTVVQFRTGDDEWSAIEIPFTGGTYGWGVVPGWIEVGVGPEDAPLGRFYAKDTGGATWSARYAGVFMRQV